MTRLAALAFNAYVARRAPLSLVHFVTERCNARCGHCFLDFSDPAGHGRELSAAEIARFASQLGPALVNVNLTGGEPFLRGDLWDISAAYLGQARVASLYVTSNGSFPERLARYLGAYRDSPWRANLQLAFSIDDFPEAHDAHRRLPGGFARALESYRLCRAFRDVGVRPDIALTITPGNHARVLPLYEHLQRDHGVTAFTVTAVREAGVAPALTREQRVAVASAYAALTRRLHEDRRRGLIEGFGGGWFGNALDAKNVLLNETLAASYVAAGAGHPPCPAGGLFAVVRANGDVHACEVRDDGRLGNLRDHDYRLAAILGSPAAGAMRARIADERCHCTYECALGVSLVSRWRYLPRLLHGAVRGGRR